MTFLSQPVSCGVTKNLRHLLTALLRRSDQRCRLISVWRVKSRPLLTKQSYHCTVALSSRHQHRRGLILHCLVEVRSSVAEQPHHSHTILQTLLEGLQALRIQLYMEGASQVGGDQQLDCCSPHVAEQANLHNCYSSPWLFWSDDILDPSLNSRRCHQFIKGLVAFAMLSRWTHCLAPHTVRGGMML